MAKFKIVLSDPETGKSQTVEVEGPKAVPLIGRKLGETIDGATIGLGGHKIKIAGGSDKDGFPMRPDIHGGVKTRVILTGGVGFHSTEKGERKRRTLRGNVITEEITQINMKIVEKPKKPKKPEKSETQKKEKKSGEAAEKPKEAEESKSEKEEPKVDKVEKSNLPTQEIQPAPGKT